MQQPDELRYIYENHEDFFPLPTFFVLPAMKELMLSNLMGSAVPGKEIALTQILHGEQYVEFLGGVPAEGKLTSKARIAEVLDKGSGAVVVFDGK